MKTLGVLAVALLAGCAGVTDIVAKREQLYGAKPVNVESPAPAAYALASVAAKAEYSSRVGVAPNAIVGLVDAGIGAANSNCRAWLGAVSAAEARWREGETNVGVLSALISGALAASGVHRDVMTAFGLGSAGVQGYSQGFLTHALAMSDYDVQVKVREAMAVRARELRAQASAMTYPQAIDAIEDFAALCTPQAARALSRSAMIAVTASVAPTGAIAVTPAPAAAVSSSFVKDDNGARIIGYWSPADVVDKAREKQIRDWLDTHGFPVSITFFSHSKLHAEARKQLVQDLQIPEAGAAPVPPPAPAPPAPKPAPTSTAPAAADLAHVVRVLGLEPWR